VSVLAVELRNFICERFMFFCFRHLWRTVVNVLLE
jgi:hypothetical protein